MSNNKLILNVDRITKNIVDEVIKSQRETAEIICDDVKRLAPKKTGEYANSIKVSDTTVNGNTITTKIYTDATVISSSGNEYNLGYLLETGTSPHLIEPVNSKVLHFQINGEDIFTKRVNHPGTIAQPHFIPALEMNKLVYKKKINEAIRRSFNG